MNEVSFQKGLESLSGTGVLPTPKTAQNQKTFGTMLAQSLREVNQLHLKADEAVTQLASGKQKDIHETMIEMEKADVAFQLLMQVRNKVIAAYETIMRMQA